MSSSLVSACLILWARSTGGPQYLIISMGIWSNNASMSKGVRIPCIEDDLNETAQHAD
jgi:hypothetical protein